MITNLQRFTFRLFAIFILLALIFAQPSHLYACEITLKGAPISEFTKFDVVFSGTVTGISEPNKTSFTRAISFVANSFTNDSVRQDHLFYNRFVEIAVNKSWKGITTTNIALRTGDGHGDCGYPFETGKQYLIYGYFEEGQLRADIRSRTQELSSPFLVDDLNYLNTLSQLPLTPTPSPILVFYILCITTILAPFILFAVSLFKRSRSSPKENSSP